MRKTLVTAATEEALDLDWVKANVLRITSTDDDIRISQLIRAAVTVYEQFVNRVLLSSTWDVYFDEFPDEYLELPPPLVSVTTVKYQDSSDVQQTMDAADYVVDTTREPGRVSLAYGESWPTTYGEPNDVVVRCVSGYGNAASIPEDIKLGLAFCVQAMYRGEDLTSVYESLWWPYRLVSV